MSNHFTMSVELSLIDLNAPTQLRMESQGHIDDLAASYEDTGCFHTLPLLATVTGEEFYVPLDGFHRLKAVESLNVANTECALIHLDTMDDAIIYAAGVNSDHGKKRESGDIANCINKILEVAPERFMESEFKLNKKAIMEVVKCSDRYYTQLSKEARDNLTASRNLKIRTLASEGLSQRAIADELSVDQKTICTVLAEEKRPMAKTPQETSKQEIEDFYADIEETPYDEQTTCARPSPFAATDQHPKRKKGTTADFQTHQRNLNKPDTLEHNTGISTQSHKESIIHIFEKLDWSDKKELIKELSAICEDF